MLCPAAQEPTPHSTASVGEMMLGLRRQRQELLGARRTKAGSARSQAWISCWIQGGGTAGGTLSIPEVGVCVGGVVL